MREGKLPTVESTLVAARRPNDKLQKALAWLKDTLHNNEPQCSKILIADAKEVAGIDETTIRRAHDELGLRDFKHTKSWSWVLDPVNEPNNEGESQSSEMIDLSEAQ